MENGAGVLNGTPSTVQPPPVAAQVVREQDRLMPIANVIRIMRRVLPPHAKISDDAKELIQECVSEFISFVTGEANERCHAEHRKTVTAEDVVWAMDRLGFDDYVLPLTAFLQRMREADAAAMATTRAPPPLAVTAPGNGVRVQRAVYAPQAPAQGYAVAMAPVQATVSPYYRHREAAYGASGSSSRGGCGDEESSSNGVPAPVVGSGTGQPVVAELAHSNPVQHVAR